MNLEENETQKKIRIQAFYNTNFYLSYKNKLLDSINKELKHEEKIKVFSAIDFSESLEYFHDDLNKLQYLIHPFRVANLIFENNMAVSADLISLALMHNVIEVSKITNKKIINSFGKKLFDAINLLTVDRKQQWERIYKKKYYDKINNSNEIIPIVKVFDKLDNIYLLCTNKNDKVRSMYLDELEQYVIPLAKKYVPSVLKTLESAINYSNNDGYISIDDLMLKYCVQVNKK